MTATAVEYAFGIKADETEGTGLIVRAVDKHGKPITGWPKVNQWPSYDAHGLTLISTLKSQPMEEQRRYVETARVLHAQCVVGERCRLGAVENQP